MREEEAKQKLMKKSRDIKKYEETLKQKRKDEEMKREVGNKLFFEATERLKQGIQRKDMGEIQLQGGHSPGKPGIVREFDHITESRGIVREFNQNYMKI